MAESDKSKRRYWVTYTCRHEVVTEPGEDWSYVCPKCGKGTYRKVIVLGEEENR